MAFQQLPTALSEHWRRRWTLGRQQCECRDLIRPDQALTPQSRAFSSSSPLRAADGAWLSRSKPRTLFVQKDGDISVAKLRVPSTVDDVADLLEETVKKLGITERLSTLTLHLQTTKTIDGKEITELGPALNSKLTLEEAGLQEGADVVVKVAGTGTPVAIFSASSLSDIYAHFKSSTPPRYVTDGTNGATAAVPHSHNDIGSTFPFVNRESSSAELFDIIKNQDVLRSASYGQSISRRDVCIPVCTGMSGLGKSRFAIDGLARGAEQAMIASHATVATTELATAVLDAVKQGRNLTINTKELDGCTVGGALAYQWMLPRCSPESSAALQSALAARSISLVEALDFIYEHTIDSTTALPAGAAPAVLINVDEAQTLSAEALENITSTICGQLLVQRRRVFVIFTGLSPTRIVDAIKESAATCMEVHLPLLEHRHMLEILQRVVPGAFSGGRVSPPLAHIMWWLGGSPRNLARLITVVRDAIRTSSEGTVTWGDIGTHLARIEWTQVDGLLRLVERRIANTTAAAWPPLVAAFSFALTTMPISCEQLLPIAGGSFASVLHLRQSGAFHFAPASPGNQLGYISVPPLAIYTARLLSTVYSEASAAMQAQIPIPALDGCAPVLSWQNNETMTVAVLLHKLYALALQQRDVEASATDNSAASHSGRETCSLSQLGIRTGTGGITDLEFTCPKRLRFRRLDKRLHAASFARFVAEERARGHYGAYVNADGASFADTFIILPDLVIFVQDKQNITARRARFEGSHPPMYTQEKLAHEFEKVKPAVSSGSVGKYIFLLVTDEDGEAMREELLKQRVLLVPSGDHPLLLGHFCAKLRETAIVASSAEFSDVRVQDLTSSCP